MGDLYAVLIILMAVYLSYGFHLTMITKSRGLWADFMFILFWAAYWYDDWKKGRLK